MIDTIYKTLLTIINKENQGYISPTEFNLLAGITQQEIYRGYFEDANRDDNKENRGLTNQGYGNLSFNERQRIDQFASIGNITINGNQFDLPTDLYFIEDQGIISKTSSELVNKVIEEIERSEINYTNNTEAVPTEQFPVYERFSDNIRVYPDTITEIEVRYLRIPKMPKWTYTVISGKELYDPTNPSFQDFELHESEFSNIILRMLSHFGINLREGEVIQIAETLKDKMNIKDNS